MYDPFKQVIIGRAKLWEKLVADNEIVQLTVCHFGGGIN